MLTVEGRSSAWNPVCLSFTKLQMLEPLTGLCQNIHSFCSPIPNSLAFTVMKQQEDSGEA